MDQKPVPYMEHVVEISEPAPGYLYVDREKETVRMENRFEIDASDSFEEMKESLKEQGEVHEKEDGRFSVIGEEAYYKFLKRDGKIEIHSKEADLTHLGFVHIDVE